MRLKTCLLPLALLTLACAGRNSSSSDDSSFDEDRQVQINSASFTCDGDDWSFDVLTSGGAVSVEAHIWQGETDLGTQDLVERGTGDWFAERSEGEVGGSCLDGDNFVEFTATNVGGDTDTTSQG